MFDKVNRRSSPLARIQGIKAKWSVVIVVAVAVTAGASQVGFQLAWPRWVVPVVSAALAFGAVQFLARGMTAPLREIGRAAVGVRRGDYSQRVAVTSSDEVGQLADAFNQMSAQLAEVNRQQREFVANASHELRTPVEALESDLQDLLDRVTEPSSDSIAAMLFQAQRLSQLVGQLLDLNRLEVIPDEPAHKLVALGVLLKDVVGECELLHPMSRIELTIAGPLGVKGDEARLRQLFTNLIGNALRFGPLGSEVTVSAVGANNTAVVSVADLGPGIAPQHQTRVFEPFWQADGTSRTGGGGRGLGLTICRRITELHDGTITVGSNYPTGAVLTVSLPLAKLDDA